jgi:hypothetical protein
MARASSAALATPLPVYQIQGANVLTPAVTQTWTGTTYGSVTGASCSWNKVKASTRAFVQICGAMYMSGLLASLPAGAFVGVQIGATDYDVLAFNFNALNIYVPFAGQRILTGIPNGNYTPIVRVRNALGAPHQLNFDNGGFFSLAIQEMV